MPGWAPHCPFLAAAAAIALAATGAPIAAAAQQQDQDNDPPNIATTEAVVTAKITHKDTSIFLMRLSMPLIPWYSAGRIWCSKWFVDNCRYFLRAAALHFPRFSAMIFRKTLQKEGILWKHTNFLLPTAIRNFAVA